MVGEATMVTILGCGDGRGEATVVAFGLSIRYFFDGNGCCGGHDWVKEEVGCGVMMVIFWKVGGVMVELRWRNGGR
ncbi:hypothetical protein FCV25MIE_09841 [Fagus crenata]